MEDGLDFSWLDSLNNAENSDIINIILNDTFRCRLCGLSDLRKNKWSKYLNIKSQNANQLYIVLLYLIKNILYHQLNEPKNINKYLLSKDINDKMAKGLSKLIYKNYNIWYNCLSKNTISAVPKLIDFGIKIYYI